MVEPIPFLWRRTAGVFFGLLALQLILSASQFWMGVPFPLSPPLFWPADRFMDFFNTNYWAAHDGRYSTWRSVYPPFAFAVARIFRLIADYGAGSVAARDSTGGLVSLILLQAVLALSLWWSARQFASALDPAAGRRRLLIFLALAISMPVVFAVDRGNYVICATAFLILHLRAERRQSVLSMVWLACAASLKPYLFLSGVLLLGRWRKLAQFGGAAILVNVLSMLVLGAADGFRFIDNFLNPSTVNMSYSHQTYASVSVVNLLYFPLHVLEQDGWFGTLRPIYLALAVSVVTGTVLYLRAAMWEDLLFIVVLAAVAIPNASFQYNLVLLYPLAPRLLAQAAHGRAFQVAWVSAVLAVSPFNVFTGTTGTLGEGPGAFPLRVTEQTLIAPLALLVVLIAYCRGLLLTQHGERPVAADGPPHSGRRA